MDRSGLDFSRIKTWLSYCDTNHHGACLRIEDPWKRVDPPASLYFVDVEDERVSLLPGTSTYLTLSYVWGTDSSPLISTTANIDDLSTSHSLAETSPLGKQLPRTIRDAMKVTRELGYRYLWVDRLCIIQDDHVNKPEHIAAMAAIYGNSSLTIIADNGDDVNGLPGVGQSDTAERHPFDVISLPDGIQLVLDDPKPGSHPNLLPEKSYHRRDWTLQEELLSNRTLKFNPQEVKWMCRKSRFREILNDKDQISDNRKSSIEIQLFKPKPDITTYGHLAEDYTSRFLTYDSDAVNAFSAIIAAFSKSMSGGMLYGVPELLFEGALLWQPREPLRRRTSPTAPSWSFLGWQGSGLSVRTWSALYLNTAHDKYRKDVYFNSQVRLLPCAEFYKTDMRTGEQLAIRSSHYSEENSKNGEDLSDYHADKAPIPQEPYPHLSSLRGRRFSPCVLNFAVSWLGMCFPLGKTVVKVSVKMWLCLIRMDRSLVR
ncbi:heterokaryon incompatibility protein-domain-containing protein [Podospora aff. communis PSN243]|uniref:Heterokaryon incompatibility protein-domain-containing protein n=1 Tax=Podospora aff. communis PSN243 TaxID=3040156 RepID=A0AAV9G7E1_9PEZI|nr:heterokaryon incompatibility protein-domain-containing protein [Podospora aff. communis PSN243]